MTPIDPARVSRITARLCVRLLRASDRDAWIAAHAASGPHFERWMPALDPRVTLAERFTAQWARTVEGARTDGYYALVAEHRVDRDLVAFLSLAQLYRGPFQNAFAAWRVGRPRANQRYGIEAVDAMLDMAFAPHPDGFGLHRVQANVIPNNEPSLRLARRVGFREEGYAKDYLEIDGRWQDHVMFAKLANEHVMTTQASP